MAKTSDDFKKFKDKINAVPELASSVAVQASLSAIENIAKDDKAFFDEVDGVFDAIGEAIPKFTNPNSNGADIASGILAITGAVVMVAGRVTGVAMIAGPLGYAIKLVGSIVGVFGNSKTSQYFNALEQMVNDAVDRVNTEQVNQDIAGAFSQMYQRHQVIAYLLTNTYSDPQRQLLYTNPDITVMMFADEAEKELGAAYKNLSYNTDKSKKDNWANAAETFYSLSQLVAFKVLYLLEGFAYFQLAESGTFPLSKDKSDNQQPNVPTRTATMNAVIQNFMGNYAKKGDPYFVAPTIQTGVITNCIYQFPENKFKFIATLYYYLPAVKPVYWPKSKTNPNPPYESGYSITITTQELYQKRYVLSVKNEGPKGSIFFDSRPSHMKFDTRYPREGIMPPYYRALFTTNDGLNNGEFKITENVYLFTISVNNGDPEWLVIGSAESGKLGNIWYNDGTNWKEGNYEIMFTNTNNATWIKT